MCCLCCLILTLSPFASAQFCRLPLFMTSQPNKLGTVILCWLLGEASIKNVFFYFRPKSCGWPWHVQGWDQNLLPPQKRATIYIARLDTINRFPSRIWAFHVAVAVRILVPGPETSSRSLSSKVYTVKPALHFLEDDAIVRGYVIAQEVDILLYSATCTRKAIRIFFSAQ